MTETPAGPTEPDAVDILTRDHRDMVELISRIEGAPDSGMRRDLADTVIAEVMRHAVAEEMYVYPVVEKHVPDGTEEVEHDKREHAELVELMKRLEGVEPAEDRFIELVRELDGKLRHHAHDEESEQFPKLRAHIPHDALVELGHKVEAAKKLAPTRPHPHAPHSELFHKTVGVGVGMVDRLRDRLTGRSTD